MRCLFMLSFIYVAENILLSCFCLDFIIIERIACHCVSCTHEYTLIYNGEHIVVTNKFKNY